MMRSLYSGVAGLKTHQTKMDVIGNNIANVNTTSFKSQSITFSDLMYQTTQTASGATETRGGVNARQIGLGAKSGAIATAIETQGATQTTNNPFDIMITGKSFFIVNNGQEQLYTRDGSFYIDGAGNLAMQSNGYFVMGWGAKEDPKTGAITVDKNGDLTNLQLMSADNATYAPASTTAGLFSGNIDNYDTNIISDDGKTITLEFYDNKGYLYTAKFSLKDTDYKEVDPLTGDERPVFSLQLTDIIDSKGNKFGKELMDKITFGDSAKSLHTEKINKGYYIVKSDTDPKLATIWQEANSPAYADATIKKSGNDLSSLMKIEGFLEDVYPIGGDKTKLYKDKYSDIISYNITSDALVIEYNSQDASVTTLKDDPALYTSVSSNNKNPYFYRADNFGYVLPSDSENGAYPLTGPLNKLDQGLLTDVYGVTIAPSDYSNYTYTFNSNTHSLTITASGGPKDTIGDTSTDKLTTGEYNKYFDGSMGKTVSQLVLEAANGTIQSSAGTNYTETSYTYNSTTGKLVVKGKYVVDGDDTKNIGVTSTSTPKLFELLANHETALDTSSSALTSVERNELKNAIGLPKMTDEFTAELSTDGNTVTITSGGYSFDITSGALFDELKARLETDPSDDTFVGNTLTAASDLETLVDSYITDTDFTFTVDASKNIILSYDGKETAVNATFTTLYPKLADQSTTFDLSTFTGNDEAKAELLEALGITDTDLTSAEFTYTARALSGTAGATVQVHYYGNITKQEEIDTFSHVSETKTPDTDVFTYGEPTAVFRNKTTNTSGYVLTGAAADGTYTLDQIEEQLGEDVLKSIYGDDVTIQSLKGDYPTRDTDQFTVTLSGSRMIVSHVQKDENLISDDYESFFEGEDNVTYKTRNPKAIKTDIPTSGNISDLLSSATGDYKGTLKEIYGLSDDYLRAFGDDGKYEFSDDLKEIKLTTGDKTIQLVFDPSNGSLVSANDNSAGKGLVNMMFDQNQPGLEAFGYQLQPGDEASLAGHMTIDFSTVTNYNTSGSATIKAVKGDKSSLNTGRAVGEMNGISISTDGQIYATYSNGQTKLLGQIATAEFANASGLSKEGDNLY